MPFVPQQLFCIAPYSSGSAALTNLEVDGSGTYSAPHFAYKPYSKLVNLGDGSVRGAGWATAVWHWDVLTETQRDWLRIYIPYQSAEVWIKTRTMDNTEEYKVFRGIAVWPTQEEEHDAHRRVRFEIKFQRLTLF
jgi:hypothetical protein